MLLLPFHLRTDKFLSTSARRRSSKSTPYLLSKPSKRRIAAFTAEVAAVIAAVTAATADAVIENGDIMMKITSKEELTKEIAEFYDMSNIESWPFVDLTDQCVGQHIDPSYAEPDIEKEMDGHEIVNFDYKSSHEEYDIMENFARTRNDHEREKIFRAISGRKPFRAFRSCVEMLGIINDWYAYKDAAFIEIAKDMMEAEGVDFVDGKIVCTKPQNVTTYYYKER